MNLHKVIEKWKKKVSWLRWFRSFDWNIHVSTFLDMCQGTWSFFHSWLSSEADLSDGWHKSMPQFIVVIWTNTEMKIAFQLSGSLGRIQNRKRIWTLLFSSPISQELQRTLDGLSHLLPTDTIQMSCGTAQCLLIWAEV